MLSEGAIFYGFMVSAIARYFWNIYLTFRQLKVGVMTKEVPRELVDFLPRREFDRNRHYAIHRRLFRMLEGTYDCVLMVIYLSVNHLAHLWNFTNKTIIFLGSTPNDLSQGLIFVFLLNALYIITHIPFGIYYYFAMDHRNGCTKRTFFFYFYDRLKHNGYETLLTITSVISIACAFKVDEQNVLGYLLYSVFLMLIAMVIMYFLYFDVIVPKRDKLIPLPDGHLKDDINQLLSSVGWSVWEVSIAQKSKSGKCQKGNAYFIGLFNRKRIVLYDTLLRDIKNIEIKYEDDKKSRDEKERENEKKKETGKGNGGKRKEKRQVETNEILAVVCHELGHWKCNHLPKRIALALANSTVIFLIFPQLFHYKPLYRAFGFDDSVLEFMSLVGVLHMIFFPVQEITHIALAIVGRRFEFECDKYAKTMGKSYYLKRALIKIHINNWGFPVNDPLYSAVRLCHPSLLERLRALDEDD